MIPRQRRARPRSGNPAIAGDPHRRLLAALLRERAAERVTLPHYRYGSPAEFVLRHGRWMTPTRRAAMAPRHCFMNAILTGLVYGWSYVEGYALTYDHGLVDRATGAVVGVGEPNAQTHAWAVDTVGHAWELTYPAPALAYVGVPFSVERADDCTWGGDASVLEDAARGHPLLEHRWRGERAGQAVPRSERLALLGLLYADDIERLRSFGLPEQAQPPRLSEAERTVVIRRLRDLYAEAGLALPHPAEGGADVPA